MIWRQRASLASRVTMLATFAVGLAVAMVAVAAYLTVRHQMYSTLDRSLLNRAEQAAKSNALSVLTAQRVPSWTLGAADVEIGFIGSDGQFIAMDRGPGVAVGDPERAVAQGLLPYSIRTVSVPSDDADFRVVAVPTFEAGSALVLAQSLEPTDDTLSE